MQPCCYLIGVSGRRRTDLRQVRELDTLVNVVIFGIVVPQSSENTCE